MYKSISVLAALVLTNSVYAQQVECIQDAKPHYFVATGTVKTTIPTPLAAVLTEAEKVVWTNTFRTFGVVSPVHADLAACNEALDHLKSKRSLPAKAPIHALQSLSYEGECLAVSICS